LASDNTETPASEIFTEAVATQDDAADGTPEVSDDGRKNPAYSIHDGIGAELGSSVNDGLHIGKKPADKSALPSIAETLKSLPLDIPEAHSPGAESQKPVRREPKKKSSKGQPATVEPNDAKGANASTQLSGEGEQTQPKAEKTSPVPGEGFFGSGKAATSDAQGAYSSTQLSGERKLTQPEAKKTSPVPDAGFLDIGKAATSDAKGAYSSTQLSGARKPTQLKAKKTSPDKEESK
jgi:hypothetical protein